jgi:very-short-patch-repair endonuclease
VEKLNKLGYQVIRFLGSVIKGETEKVRKKLIKEICQKVE